MSVDLGCQRFPNDPVDHSKTGTRDRTEGYPGKVILPMEDPSRQDSGKVPD